MEVHLRGGLGVRRELKDELDTVDGERLSGPADALGRRKQAGDAEGHRLAIASVDLPRWCPGKERTEHVNRATSHRRAREDILLNRMLHEALRRDDSDPAGPDIGIRDDALRAAVVIPVRMRIDQRDHGLVPQMLVDEIERGPRRLDRAQRVYDDPPGVPLDKGDVRNVESADLVHAVGDFEEPAMHVELSEPPETRVRLESCRLRVYRPRRSGADKRVGGKIPGEWPP